MRFGKGENEIDLVLRSAGGRVEGPPVPSATAPVTSPPPDTIPRLGLGFRGALGLCMFASLDFGGLLVISKVHSHIPVYMYVSRGFWCDEVSLVLIRAFVYPSSLALPCLCVSLL